MKKILLCLLTFTLIFSLVGCKHNDEPEDQIDYPDSTKINYSYEHFYLDLKLSQHDYSSVLYLPNDYHGYTYIPRSLNPDYTIYAVSVTRYWFTYEVAEVSDLSDLIKDPSFQVRVYRTEKSINNAKNAGNIDSNKKHSHISENLCDLWYVMLDEDFVALCIFDKEIGVNSYDKFNEYVSFEKFDSTQFYGYESGS